MTSEIEFLTSPDVFTKMRKSVKRTRIMPVADDELKDRAAGGERNRVRRQTWAMSQLCYSSSVSWPAATGTVSCLQTLERTESLVGSQTLLHCQMVVRAWGSCSSNPFIMSLVVAVLFSFGAQWDHSQRMWRISSAHSARSITEHICFSFLRANGKTTPGLVFV